MASSMLSSATVTPRTGPTEASLVAPFAGLKSSATFPAVKRANDITSIASNGAGRTQCMQVWPPNNKKKFETLSYLPPLTDEQLNKQVDYLLKHRWIPCVEFTVDYPHVHRENHRSPGYYDGRYWTMWKLPMFGCTDSSQVLKEIEEVKKAYPVSHVRIIGFDNIQQVQCCSFIVHKPQP